MIRMVKMILVSTLIIFLASCGTTVGLQPKTTVSGFDNAQKVVIYPHGADCRTMTCISIGATWISNKPEIVGINVLVLNSLVSIHKVDFNVDGKIITLTSSALTGFDAGTPAYKGSSEKTFIHEYTLIRDILSAKKVWVRAYTSDGVLENAIIDGDRDSKAYHALKRFEQQVSDVN